MNEPDCTKCGCRLPDTVVGPQYCHDCKVRLGLIPFSLGKAVTPGPADFYKKQLDEPVLDTWLIGYEETAYEERKHSRSTIRKVGSDGLLGMRRQTFDLDMLLRLRPTDRHNS